MNKDEINTCAHGLEPQHDCYICGLERKVKERDAEIAKQAAEIERLQSAFDGELRATAALSQKVERLQEELEGEKDERKAAEQERDEIHRQAAELATEQRYAKEQAIKWNDEAVRMREEVKALNDSIGYWKKYTAQARKDRDNFRSDALAAKQERDELRQQNAALLEGCRAIYSDMQHGETLGYYETNPKEFVAIVVNTLGILLSQYDTAQPTPQLRPTLQWFAIVMEQMLRANDHKGGWHQCTMQYLYEKLDEEVGELSACLSDEEVIREAADVANIAMMIADRARQPDTAQGVDKPILDRYKDTQVEGP